MRRLFRIIAQGYDPGEVDVAITSRDAKIARLESEAQRLSELLIEHDGRLRAALDAPIEALRGHLQLDRDPAGGADTRTVEVEIGPLSDFARLTAVEDAIKAIDGVADVTVARFATGRALLQVTMRKPARLIDELRTWLEIPVTVRTQSEDRIVLDVAAGERAA